MITNSIPVSLQSIWKRNHCQLKWIRKIVFLEYYMEPDWVGVYPWVFLNLQCLSSINNCQDVRGHQKRGFSYILQSVLLHEHEIFGAGLYMAVPLGEYRVFAVFLMGNPFGIWASYPFSKAHQATSPCFSLDSNHHIASIRRFRHANVG